MDDGLFELFPGVEVRVDALERVRLGFLALLGEHGERVMSSSTLWSRIVTAAGALPAARFLDVCAYQTPHPNMPTLLLAGVKIGDVTNAYMEPTYVTVYADSDGEVSPAHGFDDSDARIVRRMLDEVSLFAVVEDVRLSADQTAVEGWAR